MNARERFLQKVKDAGATSWRNAAASTLFIDATDAAMLQLNESLGVSHDMPSAAANRYRMEGAAQFLSILKKIGDIPEKPSVDKSQLDYNLK